MKTIQYKELTAGRFERYGRFSDLKNPEGIAITSENAVFYRDIIPAGYYEDASLSVCQLNKSEMIIKGFEYHSNCCEVILPIDGDIVIPLSPAVPNDDTTMDGFESFFVPQGTLLFLRKGVRHGVSFPVDKDTVNLLIILPERTYANDCVVNDLNEEDYITILKQQA